LPSIGANLPVDGLDAQSQLIAEGFTVGEECQVVIVKHIRRMVRRLVFGDTLLPQEFTIGLNDSQMEISVWLYGAGKPIDVTRRYSMACASPLTLCLALERNDNEFKQDGWMPRLRFCESSGENRVLGDISLKLVEVFPADELLLFLFEVRRSRNYCLSLVRQWTHYLLHAFTQWGQKNRSGIMMSFLEKRSAMVMFIRPHPTSLGSVLDNSGGNIFPMNIMGELGSGYFAFALKDSRLAAHFVERTGRIALSSVPFSQAHLPFQLAINHTKQSIEWSKLPFATERSRHFNIPVPNFALRVREMEIRMIRKIGSHTLFIARIISDERYSNELELCVVHGFYQHWRLRERKPELEASIVQDSLNKRGLYPC
jgi:flavin reductase (DIM6/NTAB) family NADH-FMN oxidoreductase RutF